MQFGVLTRQTPDECPVNRGKEGRKYRIAEMLGTLFLILIHLAKQRLEIFGQLINFPFFSMQSLATKPLQKPITQEDPQEKAYNQAAHETLH
jgi:hypothetical protein